MLNFKNTNILFVALLLLSIGADVVLDIPWYTYLILAVVYSARLFYGCYYVGSNFFIPIICSVKTDKKVVAISFDDGPHGVNTPKVLQILKDHNARAAFFCIGECVEKHGPILKQTYQEGHVIGNHTFTHAQWFDMFSADKMLADMRMMDEATRGVIEQTPKLFRPPYGVTNPNLKNAIVNGRYTPIGWSVRSLDTVIKDKQKLLNKVTKRIKPGAVFLFHDTCDVTVAILPDFLKYIASKGYQVMRLDEMINLQVYA